MSAPRILLAPLDWGLGHATRSIPIVRELQAQGAVPVIAADGRPAELLKKEFPDLEHIRYPGYTIDYPVNANMAWTMFRQLPTFFRGIRKEHTLLQQIIREHAISGVISDNRWGASSPQVPSVIVIHQLRILLSPFIRWGQRIVDRANGRLLRPFDEIWIPDLPDHSFSGELSHDSLIPANGHFIGPLSRMRRTVKPNEKKTIDLLVILSGPEPQRTIFETIVAEQAKKEPRTTLIVRGMPEKNVTMRISETVTMVSALTADALSAAIASSSLVICRPGYSTVMDLSVLGARAVLVPTPQQTEQEYLARMLKTKKVCYMEPQDLFSLPRAIERSANYSGFSAMENDPTLLRERVRSFLSKVSA